MSASVLMLVFVSLNPLPSLNARTDTTAVSCSSYHTSFVIVASEKGYNDSVDHGVPNNYWPVLCAHQGTTVRVTVENLGSEPHGFAIGYYYEGGASISQGDNFTISFQAVKSGSFLIYCTILCAVHPWMLNGLLVIT